MPITTPYFDSVAKEYSTWYQGKHGGAIGFQIRKNHVLNLFGDMRGNVLDVGCGSGTYVDDLLKRDCHVWGVDASSEMVKQCLDKYKTTEKAQFTVALAEDLPFPAEHFDVVFCIGVMDRVRNGSEILKELSRVLKPDATLIMSLPNRLSPYLQWRNKVLYTLVRMIRPMMRWFSRKGKVYATLEQPLYTEKSITGLMSQSGLTATDISYFCYNPLLPPLDKFFPRIAGMLMQKLERLTNSRLRRLGYGFVVKARKS